jgi:hypothetical protein
MKSYKRELQIGTLIAAITISGSLKSLYYSNASSLDFKTNTLETNIADANTDYNSLNYPPNTPNIFIPFKVIGADAKTIAQTELLNKIKESPDKDLIPEVYTPEGLDSYLESMAKYKKSPEEEAFDKTLNKVLRYDKYKSLDSTLVDYYLIKASAWQESRFDSTVVSKANAISYMQVQEGTHLTFRPQDKTMKSRFNTANNIEAGIDYYLYLINYVKNNHPRADTLSNEDVIDNAIVSYNSGHGAFTHINTPNGRKPKPEYKKWKIEFMPKESREHLVYVRDKMEELKIRDKTIEYAKEYVARRDQLFSAFQNL